jgi:tetratricopeptide (TPR) repeat protein
MTRKVLAFAVLVLVAALVGCAPTQSVKKVTDEELKALRDSAAASSSIALTYYQQNNFESALENFHKALAYDSTYFEAYVGVGLTHRKMRDAVQAEEYFRKAIKVDPTKPKGYEGLGDLFYSMGRLEDALKVYEDGLRHDSSLVDLYSGAAEVCDKMNQPAKSESLLNVAMMRFPDEAKVQRLWSDFLYKHGRYAEAEKALIPVVARFPKLAELRQKLADVQIELKKYDEAVAQFDTILVDSPSDNQTLLRKGAVLMVANKVGKAIDIFNELLKRDSTKASYHAYLGEAQAQKGNAGAAEAQFLKALSLQPGMAQAYFGLGDLKMRAADVKRGKDVTATSTPDLKTARSLYGEARGYFDKAAADEGYAADARARTEYVRKALEVVEKELFVRQ